MNISCPNEVKWIALAFAIAFSFMAAFSLYNAVQNEITGCGSFHYGPKGMISEKVSKLDQPAKFSEATNKKWFQAAYSFLLAYVGLRFYLCLK
jgi:hypothetical protein